MGTTYEEKINKLSDWYDYLMMNNRLLLTVNGSENFKNMMLNSTVVHTNTYRTHTRSIILENETFGLFQIEFRREDVSPKSSLNPKFKKNIKIKPFGDFDYMSNYYLNACNQTININSNNNFYKKNWFETSDTSVLYQVFESDFESDFEFIWSMIEEVNAAQKSSIYSTIRDFIQSGRTELVETDDGLPMFESPSGLSFSSAEDLYKKLKEELEAEFLGEHSNSIKKSKRFKKKLNSIMRF